jgi:hypothetical protein
LYELLNPLVREIEKLTRVPQTQVEFFDQKPGCFCGHRLSLLAPTVRNVASLPARPDRRAGRLG